MRRVVCAAIRGSNGRLLLGVRHYSQDMIDQMNARIDIHAFVHRMDDDQGFVDQHGVYMTRAEAFRVAKNANQIVNYKACTTHDGERHLYSEGLY